MPPNTYDGADEELNESAFAHWSFKEYENEEKGGLLASEEDEEELMEMGKTKASAPPEEDDSVLVLKAVSFNECIALVAHFLSESMISVVTDESRAAILFSCLNRISCGQISYTGLHKWRHSKFSPYNPRPRGPHHSLCCCVAQR